MEHQIGVDHDLAGFGSASKSLLNLPYLPSQAKVRSILFKHA
jgi:hypothetical protein